MRLKFILPTIISGLFFAGVMYAQAVGLGISPSRIIIENGVRNAHIEREVVLSRSNADGRVSFNVQTEGDTASWVTTEPAEDFTIPSGVNRFPVTIIIDVPDQAANGDYTGNVRFIATSEDGEGNGNDVAVSVNAVASIDISISGDQLLEYSVSSIQINPIEEGLPIQASLTLDNTGNVAATPAKIEIEFWDKFREEFISDVTLDDFSSSEGVSPFGQGDFIFSIQDHGLETGQYWAISTVYNQENEVVFEEEIIFDVVDEGALMRSGVVTSFTTTSKSFQIGEIVKFSSEFQNTGESNFTALLEVEIRRDGKLVDLLQSEKATFRQGESQNLSVFYTPEEKGDYSARAVVKYSGETTDPSSLFFTVGKPYKMTSIAVAIGGAVALIVILVVLVIHHNHSEDKKKKKKSSKKSKKK